MRPAGLPRWANQAVPVFGLLVGIAPAYLAALLWYGGSPQTTDVGYRPSQPAAFSHAQHAGDLAIDCRYCHDTVTRAARAALPPGDRCMICHKAAGGVWAQSRNLTVVRRLHRTGQTIPWVRVHDLPDYVFFDHRAHVTRGVGCVSCHGRVDQMELVSQTHPLSMGWCLDCHRSPGPQLRPLTAIASMTWQPPAGADASGDSLRQALNVNPSTDCTACHR